MGKAPFGIRARDFIERPEASRISSIHRYPMSSLLFDGIRAAFGVSVTLGPLLFLEVALPMAVLLGGLSAVFLVFTLKLTEQCLSWVELSGDGMSRRGPLARQVAWTDVTALKLACYATPRRPSEGWYRLTVIGGDASLKVDSTIDGFGDIVAAAVGAAEANGLVFDPTTTENLVALGHGASRRAPMS